MGRSDFLWNEVVYGGHWFSISATAVVFSVMLILEVKIRWELLLIVYLLIQCLFNYNHYKELDIDIQSEPNRSSHLKIYRNILPYLTFSYGAGFSILILYFGDFVRLLFAFLLLFIGLLFTKLFKSYTKKIIGFKTYYTAFTFSLLTVIFTAIYCSYPVTLLLIELYFCLSFRFMIGTSFSDIKDIATDKTQKLLTLPIYFGKKQYLNFLHLFNIITMFTLLFLLIQIKSSFSLFLFFDFCYVIYFIEKGKNEKTDIQSLTSIIVDGEFIFWPFFLFIALIFFL